MKKLFFSVVAIVALFATSCVQADIEDTLLVGGDELVTISLESPTMGSRAEEITIGKGLKATQLQYAIYDEDWNCLKVVTNESFDSGLKKELKLRLVKNKTYNFVFWAQAPNKNYYTVNLGTVGAQAVEPTIKVAYGTDANDDYRDAFFGNLTHKVEGSAPVTVYLKRPFAQINFGTNDVEDAKAMGFDIANATTSFKVVAHDTLNLKSGVSSGDVTVERTFVANELPENKTLSTDAKGDYHWVAMNYILWPDADNLSLSTCEMTIAITGQEPIVVSVPNAPARRNWRTNLVGSLLTQEGSIFVEILPGFVPNGEFTNATGYYVVDGVYHILNATGLAWVAEQVNSGATTFAGETIVLDEDIDLTGFTRAAGEWTPIGTDQNPFQGTFDGVGHKVSNFQVTTVEGYAGLFGNVHVGAVRNVSVENVKIVANHYAGAVVGKGYVRIDNCHAKNVEITLSVKNGDWGDKAGAILGQNGEGESFYVKNCSAENVNIKGYRDLGGIVGMAHNENTVSGCSVKDITIVQDLSVDYETPAKRNTLGGVAGRLGANVTLENNTEENVAITTEVKAPEALASTLTLNSENIAVTLVNDLDVAISSLGEQTGGSGEYKLGGEDTENITIDLNGKRLNITTTYWSAIGAKNNDATITIKNGTMTSTGNSAGTWNAWDLRFSNCNYVFEDVVFEKAVALDNVGKSTLMNNVTITDNHDEDTYGLWITAEGQTVTLNNCTIDMLPASDGRGIKIDNQYVAAADEKKVTLNVTNVTFKTDEKAAILVKSTAGAEINASELNISAVAADTEFAVWVDEDAKAHAAKVVVNGANVKVEGEIVDMVSVDSVPALKDALVAAGSAGAGHTVIELADGEYTMPSDWTPITVDGYNGADIVTVNGNGAVLKGMTTSLFNGGFAGGSGIVIKNLTIEGATIVANNDQGYGAFVNCADSMNEITLINCHLINSTIITPNDGADESRMGGLVGWTSGYSNVNDGPVKTYVNIKDCSVVGCTLKGAGSIGGICGHAGASDWTYTTIENCRVENNNLISTDSGSWRVGVAVGTANIGQVVVNNLTESGNTLTQGSLVAPTGVRSYVGRLSLGTTGSFVVDGVAITE